MSRIRHHGVFIFCLRLLFSDAISFQLSGPFKFKNTRFEMCEYREYGAECEAHAGPRTYLCTIGGEAAVQAQTELAGLRVLSAQPSTTAKLTGKISFRGCNQFSYVQLVSLSYNRETLQWTSHASRGELILKLERDAVRVRGEKSR